MSACPFKGIEIPKSLSHLPVYHGMPIPFVQVIDASGKPDFRVTDVEKVVACLKENLCAICGNKLREIVWFTGGPLCVKNRLFSDPAMHEECARFCMKICPFLSGAQRNYANVEVRPVNLPDHLVMAKGESIMSTEKTEKQFLLKCWLKDVRPVMYQGTILSQAQKPWMAIEEYDR